MRSSTLRVARRGPGRASPRRGRSSRGTAAPAPGRRTPARRASSRGARRAGSSPTSVTCPRSGRSRPTSSRASVDLPLPFGPTSAIRSPSAAIQRGVLEDRATRARSRSVRSAAVSDSGPWRRCRQGRADDRHLPRPAARCPPRASTRRTAPRTSAVARRRSAARRVRGQGPGRRAARRSPTRCSIRTIVVDRSSRRARQPLGAASRLPRSRFAVGSSRTRMPGRAASTPASASRCCCPPDSVRDRLRSAGRRGRPTPAPRGHGGACGPAASLGSRGRTRRRPRPAP